MLGAPRLPRYPPGVSMGLPRMVESLVTLSRHATASPPRPAPKPRDTRASPVRAVTHVLGRGRGRAVTPRQPQVPFRSCAAMTHVSVVRARHGTEAG